MNKDFEAGYREILYTLINHITYRIEEEKLYGDMWLNKDQYDGYVRALQDMKNYLQFLSRKPSAPDTDNI